MAVAFQFDPGRQDNWGTIKNTGGAVAIDAAADDGKAWVFRKGTHTSGSRVFARHPWFRGREAGDVEVLFRYRGVTVPASDSALFYYGVRDFDSCPPICREFERDSVMVAEASATYDSVIIVHDIPHKDSTHNFLNELYIEWAGEDTLWADWIEDSDERGRLLFSHQDDALIRDFVRRHSYETDPNSSTIIGFWLDEERWEDANVLPQLWVERLIKQQNASLIGFTENHYLEKWAASDYGPERYGGRDAISARFTKDSLGGPVYVSGLSYPITGYNPNVKRVSPRGPETYISPAAVPLACSVSTDTTICFQTRMTEEGQILRHYKRFADSLNAMYVPFMQAMVWITRSAPTKCSDDTTWRVNNRAPTAAEANCHAGLALANGVNGLVYFKYDSSYHAEVVQRDCDAAPFWFQTDQLPGLTSLPGVQDALRNFIGPFVDSLGHYFADFNWVGGGRVDPWSDSTGLAEMFDSVKSLSYTLPGEQAFIEGGVYDLPSDTIGKYFLLVNRHAHKLAAQTIRVWMPLDTSVHIIDLWRNDTISVTNRCGQGTFSVSIDPGKFKLFKRVPASERIVTGVLPAGTHNWDMVRRVPPGDSLILSNGDVVSLTNEAPYVSAGCDCGTEEILVEGLLKVIGSGADSSAWPTIKHSGMTSGYPRGFHGIRILPGGRVEIDRANILGAAVGLTVESDAPSSVRNAFVLCDSGVAAIYCEGDSLAVRGKTVLYTKRGTGFSGYYADVDLNDVCFDLNDRHLYLHGCTGDVRNCHVGRGSGGCDSIDTPHVTATYGIYAVGGGASPLNVDSCRVRGPFSQSGIRKSSSTGSLYINRTSIEGMGPTPYGVYADGFSYINMRCSDICGTAQSAIYAYKSASDFGNGSASQGRNDIHNYTGKAATAIATAIKAEYNWWGLSCASVPGVLQTSSSVDYQPCLGTPNYCAPWYGSCTGGGDPPPPPPPPLEKVVETDSPESDPGTVRLEDIYPNPFNAATVVRFYLPEPTEAHLIVYNVLGQQVAELASGVQTAGWHNITWDGSSEAGRTLASGVYLLRLQAGGVTATRKLALVR